MPAPSDALAQDVQRTRSGRWKMLLLALVCAAPVAASYFSYYVWRPGGGTSLGVLIDPQRPIPALAATDLSGQPFDLRKLQGQWLLVSVGAARCDARAAFMRDVIGMKVPDCLLPLADTCGIVAPYLLDPELVVAL